MNWWLILAGFLVHLTFFYSIFDIYFTSPLVHGMTPHSSTLAPPADRLVLFVADGLRADKLYEFDENGTNRAPYLRHIMESVGAWGVSHTRVPTESRPGHVALIAGFYEDVSAVAKGWKENPVEFDSLFNESAWTWSWGSPDILPMFAHSAHRNHVYTKMYPAESEDFAGAELFKLDTWVFDSVKDFFSNAKEDEILLKKLLETKVVFFLHLLGLDTNGHAHRPYSAEYLENIRLVDNGIKEIVELFDSFYGDNKTAFVLTADHGMTNWGSHGAGHPSETLTPLIAWGAGIRSPVTGSSTQQHFDDDFLTSWKLEHIKRSDVNQADVCPLMASVIGVPYPLNSVGVLPVDYLEDNLESKAVNLFTNAKQVLEQYRVKMEQKKKTTLSAFFIPFRALKNSHQAKYVQHIHSSISSGSYEKAIKESQKLLDLALEGLTYYHNYDRFFLGASITMGFLGWMGYLLTLIIQHDTSLSPPRNQLDWKPQGFLLGEKGIRLIFCGIGIIVFCLLYIQHLQWTYYIYCLTPVVLWQKIFQRRKVLQALYWYIVDHGILLKTIILSALGLVGLEIIVSSFFTRELLSIGLVAIAVWPFFNLASKEKIPPLLGCAWCAAALGMAVFPLLPVVGRAANYPLVYVAGILTICLGLLGARNISQQSKIKGNKQLLWVQFLLILIATGIVFNTSSSISEKEGLPLLNQICSWIILGLSLVLPLCSTTVLKPRLLHLGLGLLPPYLLLSTSHEALFALLLLTFMFLWIQVEATLASRHKGLSELDFSQDAGLLDTPRKLQLADLRIGYFFIYFLIVGFFGTGNIASINSFDPASVMCFLTVFSPFVMGALMLIKVLIPFLLVCSAFHGVHLTIRVPTQSLVLVVLLMSDFMALHFFFLVQDYGSWLEIGTSISHYVIVMAMICFLLILLAVSKVLTHVTLLPKKKHHSL